MNIDCTKLKDYIMFDVETTGLSPDTESIIELCQINVSCDDIVNNLHIFSKYGINNLVVSTSCLPKYFQ